MNYKVIKQWKTNEGYDAVVVAVAPIYPHYCGYVAISEDHPAYGKEGYTLLDEDKSKYTEEYIKIMEQINELRVHGGLTYAEEGMRQGENVKYPYPIPTEYKSYWFGFDAAHAGDTVDWELGKQLITTDDEKMAVKAIKPTVTKIHGDVIRTLEYMVDECNSLSKQLGEIK